MNGGSNMLYTDFTEKLLGLQDVIITNVEESEKEIIIYAELKRKKHNCICCGTAIESFEKCAVTMRNWFSGIINSFDTNITNGFTEGCNNKIKVLKRNAYGYRNFRRFRNRILHMFYYKTLALNSQAAT